MQKVIGLTGSIATGKSTVARMFLDEGIYVIDSDNLAKQAQSREEVLDKIVSIFGNESVVEGKLDRVYLAKIIFNDSQKREELNKIMHPIVKQDILNLIKKRKNKLVVVDVPLMYETDFHEMMDEIIVVYATREQQIERLMLRNNLTYDAAIERIDAQMPIEEKVAKADYVLDNSHTKHELYLQFKALYKYLMQKKRKCENERNNKD